MKESLKYGAPMSEDWIERAKVPRAERVEAIQADRQAAAELGKRWFDWTDEQVLITLEGRGDDYPIVQAMARHRLNCAMPVYSSLDEIPERP